MDALEIDGQMMEALAPVIRSFVDRAISRATEPLLERLAVLEAREPVVVEKVAAEPLRLDEFRNEFGMFLADSRAALAEQKTVAAEVRAQLPDPADLRKAVDTVALEGKAALAEMTAKAARLETELRERADAEAARVSEALAKVKDGKDGVDGKSIDIERVRVMAAAEVMQAVADLPKPQDGRTPTEDEIAPIVAKAVEAIPLPKDGRDGADGKDADPEFVRALIVKEVDERMTAIPRPQDGRDGRDGKDVDWSMVERQIEIVAKGIIAELPAPKDGASADRAEIEKMVIDAVAAIPVPKDGRDGIDGRDGKGIEDAFIGRDGELILTFGDGRIKSLGAGFAKDITADALREMVSDAAADLHQGLWEPKPYRKGMWVTYGGSIFAARGDVDPAQRPLASEAWKMILQRGRDGKDAVAPKQPRPPMALPPKEGE